MIEAVHVPLGRAALVALRDALAEAKADHPLAPVTVLVDDNAIGVATRRALASGDLGPVCGDRAGVAAVQFSTVYRYGELLGAPLLAAAGRRPVSTPVIAAALRRVLADHPGVFAAVADHPTTERRLVAAHRELSELDEAQLEALAGAGDRAATVVDIHRRVSAALAPSWYGEQDLLAAAIEVVDRDQTGGTREPIVVYLPRELSPSRAALLRRLAERSRLLVIAGHSGRGDADAIVAASLRRLGIADAAAERGPSPPPGRLRIVSVSDADDEVRHAVRGVVAAAHDGVPLDRMAIVYGARDPYARLVDDHLTAAGIPTNGAAVASLATSLAGRTLLRLLDLGERGFRRDDVIDLIAGTPMRWRGRPVPSRTWDELSRSAGIVRGRRQWHDRLIRLRDEERARHDAWSADPERQNSAGRIERRIAAIDDLLGFVEHLADRLAASTRLRSWAALVAWVRDLLEDHLDGQQGWPEAERRAYDRIDAALTRLASLDAIDPHPTVSVFRRSLELELDAGLGRSGSTGSGVLVGPPAMAVGTRLDHVWVLGLAEGTFPAVGRDDSLLPDRERRLAPDLATSSDRSARQHLDFLAVLAAAEDGTAHLLHPRGDLRRSESRTPSRWLLDTLGDQLGRRIESDELALLDHPVLHHVASFAAALGRDQPATPTEFDLAALVADPVAACDTLAIDDTVMARGAAMVRSRRSPTLTRFDGLVDDGRAGPWSLSRPLSATALESWARCPYRYFVQRILGVDPIEVPEQRVRIDALERGTLIHRILERFVAERSRPDAIGWDDHDRARLERITAEECDLVEARGLTGEPLYWRRDRATILRDLRTAVDCDDQARRAEGRQPVATELAFGFGDTDAVTIRLPNGRTIAVRGSIDLVDRCGDTIVVTDYKTGRKGTKLSDARPHEAGTRLQLVLYALAARRLVGDPEDPATSEATIESRYWHIHRPSRFDRNGYIVTPGIEAEVLRAVGEIVDMIDAGVFPQHPVPTTRQEWVECPWCDPDGLGVGDARRRMERKAADPRLARYLALAEPAGGAR